MSGNPKIDKIREAERRKRILTESFRLFAEKGIEGVSMVQITRAAGVGDATIYTYYANKPNLVIAVSAAVWGEVWADAFERRKDNLDKVNAYENIEFYTDEIIRLYKERPDLLRFSSNFKTYLHREGFRSDEIVVQTDRLSPMRERFGKLYQKAKEDKSIRTDIPEDELFTTVVHTMLSMAERYTLGLVWADNNPKDHTKELLNLKQMILMWCKG